MKKKKERKRSHERSGCGHQSEFEGRRAHAVGLCVSQSLCVDASNLLHLLSNSCQILLLQSCLSPVSPPPASLGQQVVAVCVERFLKELMPVGTCVLEPHLGSVPAELVGCPAPACSIASSKSKVREAQHVMQKHLVPFLSATSGGRGRGEPGHCGTSLGNDLFPQVHTGPCMRCSWAVGQGHSARACSAPGLPQVCPEPVGCCLAGGV